MFFVYSDLLSIKEREGERDREGDGEMWFLNRRNLVSRSEILSVKEGVLFEELSDISYKSFTISWNKDFFYQFIAINNEVYFHKLLQ